MKLTHSALVLVDISGYTQFIQWNRGSVLHAEEIITELLEAVIDEAEYPLELNKLEGDAALLHTEINHDPQAAARDVLKQVTRFIEAFREKQQQLIDHGKGGCGCPACTNIHRLKLKAFLHTGEVVVKQIRHFTELAGESVITIHRMLKNNIDADEYILLTDDYFRLTGDLLPYPKSSGVEQYPGFGPVVYHLYFPEPAPEDLQPQAEKPMSRLRGILEVFRIQLSIFLRRVFRRSPEGFTHIPYPEEL